MWDECKNEGEVTKILLPGYRTKILQQEWDLLILSGGVQDSVCGVRWPQTVTGRKAEKGYVGPQN